MISEEHIKKSIVKILKDNKFRVIAQEQKEGFKKPACFVSVYPSTVTTISGVLEEVTDTIEIRYYPSIETTEECAKTAQTIRSLLCHKILEMEGGNIRILEMETEIDDYILTVELSTDPYIQSYVDILDDESMDNLEMVQEVEE